MKTGGSMKLGSVQLETVRDAEILQFKIDTAISYLKEYTQVQMIMVSNLPETLANDSLEQRLESQSKMINVLCCSIEDSVRLIQMTINKLGDVSKHLMISQENVQQK